ncbi:LysR family transcriptional regulator [Myxococcus stipitatus]|uniref:LysR family transcriptional regulator n=1 Tax=Myxococcus stipitatus TaxID=83455 RepID=UPI001F41FC38|nr:LysR family transcriptional regulator [Myxococcus stipitatus]MCE9668636.1 LysR family transcriptional regulator [Myxococcus stipitatus]
MADLDLLRSFLAIYRAGAISRATQTVHLTQPALSAQLQALEARLGRALFTRKARGVEPTPAGHALAQAAAAHIDALDVLVDTLSASGPALEGTLYLGGPAEMLTTRVLPALAPLVARGLTLEVRLDVVTPLLEALGADELDLVVASRKVGARGLEYQPLYDEELVLVAAPAWAEKLPRELLEGPGGEAALARAPLLAYADDLPLLRRYFRACFDTRVRGSARAVVPDLRAVMVLAEAGAGVTVLPRYLCEDPLQRGALVELMRPAKPVLNRIHLATREARTQAPRIQAAVELLLRAAPTW